MEIFIDSANVKEIEKWLKQGIADGVTTNPSIMLKDGISDLKKGTKKIGVGKPEGIIMEIIEHARQLVLHRRAGRGDDTIRNTGHIQHRPGEPVHVGRVHGHPCRQRHKDKHGRQGPLDGQHLHREALEDCQVRRHIPESI